MARQSSLNDETRLFQFVLTEQALRWQYSDPDTMLALIANVGKVSQLPNVDLSIVPLAAREVRSAPLNTFTVYDERIATVELFSGSVALRDPRDIAYHVNLFDYFRSHAAAGTEALALLDAISNEIAQPRG
jgi:hypothetical protein